MQAVIEYAEPHWFEGLTFVFINIDGLLVPFRVVTFQEKKSPIVYLELQGITSEASAKEFVGKVLFVPHKDMPEIEEEVEGVGMYIDWQLFDQHSSLVGQIAAAENYAGNTVLQVQVDGKEAMVPFNEQMIVKVDEAKRELHLDIPDGLLDIYLNV